MKCPDTDNGPGMVIRHSHSPVGVVAQTRNFSNFSFGSVNGKSHR